MFCCCAAKAEAEVCEARPAAPAIDPAEPLDVNVQPVLKVPPEPPEPVAVFVQPPAASAASAASAALSGSFDIFIGSGPLDLGLDVDKTSSAGPMVTEIRDGAVRDFNKHNPKSCVQPYDVITHMNGVKGMDVGEAVSSPLVGEVNMTLKRPRKIEVTVSKKSILGLKLDYRPTSLGVIVREIKQPGLLATWNAEHPDDAVGPEDRILGLNGKTYRGDELVDAMRNESELHFTVLKY